MIIKARRKFNNNKQIMKKIAALQYGNIHLFVFLSCCCIGILLNFCGYYFSNESPFLCFLVSSLILLISIILIKYTDCKILNKKFINSVRMSIGLEKVLNMLPYSIFGVDNTGIITYLNKTAQKSLDYKENKIIGRWFGEVLVFEDQTGLNFLKNLKNIRSINESVFFPHINFTSISGKRYLATGHICPIKLNLFKGAFIVFLDETNEYAKKNKSELKLDLLEKKYNVLREVFNSIPFGIMVSDSKTMDVIYSNRMFRKIHDLPLSVPVTKATIFKMLSLSQEYRQLLISNNELTASDENKCLWLETSVFNANGEERYLSINSKVNQDLNIKIISVSENIDKIKKRIFLKEAIFDYQCLLNNSIDGLMILDHRGVVIRCSDNIFEFTGISSANAIGRQVWEIENDIDKQEDVRRSEFIRLIREINLTKKVVNKNPIEIKRIKNSVNNRIYTVEITSNIEFFGNYIRIFKIYKNISSLIDRERKYESQKIFIKHVLSLSIVSLYIYNLNEGKVVFSSSVSPEYKAENFIEFKEKKTTFSKAKFKGFHSDVFRISSLSGGKWLWRREIVYSRSADGKIEEILGNVTDITDLINSDKFNSALFINSTHSK